MALAWKVRRLLIIVLPREEDVDTNVFLRNNTAKTELKLFDLEQYKGFHCLIVDGNVALVNWLAAKNAISKARRDEHGIPDALFDLESWFAGLPLNLEYQKDRPQYQVVIIGVIDWLAWIISFASYMDLRHVWS